MKRVEDGSFNSPRKWTDQCTSVCVHSLTKSNVSLYSSFFKAQINTIASQLPFASSFFLILPRASKVDTHFPVTLSYSKIITAQQDLAISLLSHLSCPNCPLTTIIWCDQCSQYHLASSLPPTSPYTLFFLYSFLPAVFTSASPAASTLVFSLKLDGPKEHIQLSVPLSIPLHILSDLVSCQQTVLGDQPSPLPLNQFQDAPSSSSPFCHHHPMRHCYNICTFQSFASV